MFSFAVAWRHREAGRAEVKYVDARTDEVTCDKKFDRRAGFNLWSGDVTRGRQSKGSGALGKFPAAELRE